MSKECVFVNVKKDVTISSGNVEVIFSQNDAHAPDDYVRVSLRKDEGRLEMLFTPEEFLDFLKIIRVAEKEKCMPDE